MSGCLISSRLLRERDVKVQVIGGVSAKETPHLVEDGLAASAAAIDVEKVEILHHPLPARILVQVARHALRGVVQVAKPRCGAEGARIRLLLLLLLLLLGLLLWLLLLLLVVERLLVVVRRGHVSACIRGPGGRRRGCCPSRR